MERGRLDELRLLELRAIAEALEIRLPFAPQWRGAEMDRLVNERHNLMHERLAAMVRARPDWECSAEVTFSIWGERGSIDLLAWHSSRRALLVVELKTEIPDAAALVAQVDRYRRLAEGIARERGWDPVSVSVWVIVADSSMNRRHLARHRTMLRNAYPMEGRTMRSWLRRPDGAVAALSFLADDRAGGTIRKAPPTRRVRPRVGALLAPDTLSSAPPRSDRQDSHPPEAHRVIAGAQLPG